MKIKYLLIFLLKILLVTNCDLPTDEVDGSSGDGGGSGGENESTLNIDYLGTYSGKGDNINVTFPGYSSTDKDATVKIDEYYYDKNRYEVLVIIDDNSVYFNTQSENINYKISTGGLTIEVNGYINLGKYRNSGNVTKVQKSNGDEFVWKFSWDCPNKQ